MSSHCALPFSTTAHVRLRKTTFFARGQVRSGVSTGARLPASTNPAGTSDYGLHPAKITGSAHTPGNLDLSGRGTLSRGHDTILNRRCNFSVA
jgi:hypothetical protein